MHTANLFTNLHLHQQQTKIRCKHFITNNNNNNYYFYYFIYLL
jgi:hypothetical protein